MKCPLDGLCAPFDGIGCQHEADARLLRVGYIIAHIIEAKVNGANRVFTRAALPLPYWTEIRGDAVISIPPSLGDVMEACFQEVELDYVGPKNPK